MIHRSSENDGIRHECQSNHHLDSNDTFLKAMESSKPRIETSPAEDCQKLLQNARICKLLQNQRISEQIQLTLVRAQLTRQTRPALGLSRVTRRAILRFGHCHSGATSTGCPSHSESVRILSAGRVRRRQLPENWAQFQVFRPDAGPSPPASHCGTVTVTWPG